MRRRSGGDGGGLGGGGLGGGGGGRIRDAYRRTEAPGVVDSGWTAILRQIGHGRGRAAAQLAAACGYVGCHVLPLSASLARHGPCTCPLQPLLPQHTLTTMGSPSQLVFCEPRLLADFPA